jgi:hypothetical protein
VLTSQPLCKVVSHQSSCAGNENFHSRRV